MTRKTNAIRLLESAGIAHEERAYEISMDAFTAEAVARLVGLPPEQVFKTLLARGQRTGPCFAVVPAHKELDLKALARAAQDRRMELVPVREVEPLTGYQRGGVTALGAKKRLPVYLDLSAADHDVISVSAGVKGLQVLLAPDDYLTATSAELAEIARVPPGVG